MFVVYYNEFGFIKIKNLEFINLLSYKDEKLFVKKILCCVLIYGDEIKENEILDLDIVFFIFLRGK